MGELAKRVALVALMLVPCHGQDATRQPGWEEFKSSTGFRTVYPTSWFRIGMSSKDRLRILSSEGGAEGIVIKRGQAEIIVVELQGSPSATLSQLIDEDSREEALILSRRDIRREHVEQGSCGGLKEVISKQDAVPPDDVPVHVPYIINTDFYCEINGRRFSTLLKNWQGDKHQERYQRVALEIAESLRLNQ